MRAQLLDSMDLERERGITIKAQAVRVAWKEHQLNLIDTPGHVDFTYEVSRSLQACEGALLVVDAAQGIEAQTLANAYLALENDLEIIPVVNKIDLPQADPDGAAAQLADLLGVDAERVLRISAKTGIGVEEVLDAVVEHVPPPAGDLDASPRALIFDSSYDQYRGVVAFVRVVDGSFKTREQLRAMALGTRFEAQELGFFSPTLLPVDTLAAGEVGYVITGLKDVSELRVGDTLTSERHPAAEPVPGYKEVKPMVFAGLFPTDSDAYPGPARRARAAEAQRRGARLRARDVAGARLRLPLRLPRTAAHGDRARAARARVRPRPARHRAERRLPRRDARRRMGGGAQPVGDAARARGRRGAVHPRVDHRAEGVRRHRDGAEQRAPRPVRPPRVPLRGARAPDVRAAARGDRARLLRPAQVAHARLRELRLRHRRLPPGRARARGRARRRTSRSTRSR